MTERSFHLMEQAVESLYKITMKIMIYEALSYDANQLKSSSSKNIF